LPLQPFPLVLEGWSVPRTLGKSSGTSIRSEIFRRTRSRLLLEGLHGTAGALL
jgi:hypothetical protein